MLYEISGPASFLFALKDCQARVGIELFVHGLELLDGHRLKPAVSTLQNAYLEFDFAELLLILFLLLLLVLLLQHL